MASEVKLPELGENVEEGEVVDVRVAAGDRVQQGQPLLEIEAEKATVQVPSPVAGRVSKLLVKKGDRVHTGQALFVIEDGDGKPAAADAKPEERVATAKEPAPKAAHTETPHNSDVAIAPQAAHQPAAPQTDGKQARPIRDGEQLVPAGPATRRLARELGVDLAKVPGSTPAGRVTQEDVKAYVRRLASGGATATGAAISLPDFQQWGPIERRPLDAIRRKTAERLTLAWQAPHVTQHDLADITDLDEFRRQQEGKGPKLTVTAFALKAAAITLRQFPHFNSSLDSRNNQLVLKHYFHIGVAVDTERGLLVPVLRDVDKKSVHDLAQELIDVAERARQKKLSLEEMQGGTFTISNLGGIGGTAFTPIINYPEVAILGISRGRLQPVARDQQFIPRLLLPLSLSYDHRVVDGADAARFTRRLADMLENPMVMLLHA